MDNLAHALTGALVARTLPAGWNGRPTSDPALDPDAETTRPGRWVMWASVVAANLPDFEALVLWPPPLGDKAAYLLHHRGWSHSLVGIAAEALLLAGLLWFAARAVSPERKLRPTSAASRTSPRRSTGACRTAGACAPGSHGGVFAGFTPLRGLAVAVLGAGSHLFLDWWNAYGVRPFYPWDKTWYYGDLVFIVDPWVWLTLGGALVCGTRRFGRAKWGWYALTFAATAAVAEACRREVVPWWVLLGWFTAVAEVAALRWWGRWRGAKWVGWGMVGAYLLAAAGVTAWALQPRAADRSADERLTRLAALPVPGVPWERAVVQLRRYNGPRIWRGSRRDLGWTAYVVRAASPLPVTFSDPDRSEARVARPAVMAADPRFRDWGHAAAVRAWASFARFPTYGEGWGEAGRTLTLGDVRYRWRDGADWSALTPFTPREAGPVYSGRWHEPFAADF